MRYNAASGCVLALALCLATVSGQSPAGGDTLLRLKQDKTTGAIHVYREGRNEPILTQNAPPDNRAYLHPIVAPDGKGVLTEYRPSGPAGVRRELRSNGRPRIVESL